MSLSEAPVEVRLTIKEINSGQEAKRKLSSLGIHKDDVVIKHNDSKWGPVILENLTVQSNKLAIGRELAKKIVVENER
ncbi:MAG: ferrous iron transport protein A [Ignavibacteria bacterium]|nr:ferrous iron transport protein A [Ignavibacteria bacterium]